MAKKGSENVKVVDRTDKRKKNKKSKSKDKVSGSELIDTGKVDDKEEAKDEKRREMLSVVNKTGEGSKVRYLVWWNGCKGRFMEWVDDKAVLDRNLIEEWVK